MTNGKNKVSVSVIVPVYNETFRLLDGFTQLTGFLSKKKTWDWELIIVDDGSDIWAKDILFQANTRRRATELLKKNKLSFHRLSVNKGKGAALSEGFAKAKKTYIVFCDIDCSVPVETLDPVVRKLSQSQIVIGSRRIPGAYILTHQSFLREKAGQIYTFLSNTLCGIAVTDATCGFKGFHKKAGKMLFSKRRINRWAFDSEILFLAKKYGVDVFEHPVSWRNKEGSKVKMPHAVLSFIDLCTIRLNDLRGKYD